MCEKLLNCLAAGDEFSEPVLLLAAHPDDEIIGAGSRLSFLRHLILAHTTDGSPVDMLDACAHGFTTCQAYAAERRQELSSALETGGIRPRAVLELGIRDQQAALNLPQLALRIRGICDRFGISCVLTHSYEGGHPDHDATACAVHAARELGAPFDIVEFTSYHLANGSFVSGDFLDNSGSHAVWLTPQERSRKRAMLDCFSTQRQTLAKFGLAVERYRKAPEYDFTCPPCAPPLHYELFPWGMDSGRFCNLAGGVGRRVYREVAA
jgi:LmbE family N-acetylglucosaminyl deacetylase